MIMEELKVLKARNEEEDFGGQQLSRQNQKPHGGKTKYSLRADDN